MAKGAAEARSFRRRFRKLDPKTGETGKKAREKVVTDLQSFVARLRTREAVEACLAAFLAEHPKLGEARSDSLVLAVFQLLVYRLTSLIQDDLLLLQGLRGRLTEDRPKDGLREVFALLPAYRQRELLKRLDDFIAIERRQAHKKKSLIDELRDAYKIRHAGRFPTLQDLYLFEPLPAGAAKDRLKAAFDARHGACVTRWRKINRKFTTENLDAFFESRKRFIDFVLRHRATGLDLYQLWFWMVRQMNVTLDRNDRWQRRVEVVSNRRLNADLYLLLTYALFLRGTADRSFPLNRAGFTSAEDQLFYAPLRHEWYAADYAFAFRQGLRSTPRFYQLAQTHLGLYLYGESLGTHVTLARSREAQGISKARAALGPGDLSDQVVDLRGQSGPDFAKGLLRSDDEVGVREGRFRIYYVAGPKQVYIEMLSLSNVLFQVTDTWLGDQVVAQAYDLIYEKTKHLADAIPFVFEVLGYLPTLVTGGLYAVGKEVVVDRVIDATIDEFGPSSTGGPGPGSAIGSVIKTLRRKSPPDGAEVARLQKTLGRLGEPKIDPDVAERSLPKPAKVPRDSPGPRGRRPRPKRPSVPLDWQARNVPTAGFTERGFFARTEKPMYMVRVGSGEPGRYADFLFDDLDTKSKAIGGKRVRVEGARTYAARVGETLSQSPDLIQETSALPRVWQGGRSGNPLATVKIWKVPAGTPYVQGVVAPQLEAGTVYKLPKIYKGGGPQVAIGIDTRKLKPVSLIDRGVDARGQDRTASARANRATSGGSNRQSSPAGKAPPRSRPPPAVRRSGLIGVNNRVPKPTSSTKAQLRASIETPDPKSLAAKVRPGVRGLAKAAAKGVAQMGVGVLKELVIAQIVGPYERELEGLNAEMAASQFSSILLPRFQQKLQEHMQGANSVFWNNDPATWPRRNRFFCVSWVIVNKLEMEAGLGNVAIWLNRFPEGFVETFDSVELDPKGGYRGRALWYWFGARPYPVGPHKTTEFKRDGDIFRRHSFVASFRIWDFKAARIARGIVLRGRILPEDLTALSNLTSERRQYVAALLPDGLRREIIVAALKSITQGLPTSR